MLIGLGFFGIFAIVGIGSLVLGIMTAVSASKYPDWAFQQTASSKFVWLGVPIILLFFCSIGSGVMGLIWFTSKRDEVERAARAGGPSYGYGPPPQMGYGPPPAAPGPPQAGWGPPPPPQWAPPPQSTPPYPPSRFPPPGDVPPPPPPAPQQ